MINASSFKKLKSLVLSLVFTNRCRFCGDVCDIRDELCENCEETLPVIEGEICYFCGVEKEKCACKKEAKFYLSVCAPYYYTAGPKKAVVFLKYRNNPQIIQRLSEDMAHCVKKRYNDIAFDYITFVPAHEDDQNTRGYNQAELLANSLGKSLDIPVVAFLKKSYKTAPQHTLSELERSGNLLGAFDFEVHPDYPKENSRILLCDDIKTTGATLNECAKTLLVNGCAEVRCVTACIASNSDK